MNTTQSSNLHVKLTRQLSKLKISNDDLKLTNYVFTMWHLQEYGGLTYKEARVLLRDMRDESIEDLCEAFDCTPQAIGNFERRAAKKITDSEVWRDFETE